MWLDVEVTELPNYRVYMSLLIIGFRLADQFFPLQVVQFTAFLQLFHNLEKPVGHAFRKLGHQLISAEVQLLASTQIFQVDFAVCRRFAPGISTTLFAQATLTVKFTQRWESLVVASANLILRVIVKGWALGNTLTDRSILLVRYAFLAPSANMVITWIYGRL